MITTINHLKASKALNLTQKTHKIQKQVNISRYKRKKMCCSHNFKWRQLNPISIDNNKIHSRWCQ